MDADIIECNLDSSASWEKFKDEFYKVIRDNSPDQNLFNSKENEEQFMETLRLTFNAGFIAGSEELSKLISEKVNSPKSKLN